MKNKNLNIVKITIVVLLCFNFFSCSDNNDVQVPYCRVDNFKTVNIFFDEFLPTLYSYNPSFDGKIYLEHDASGKINKVVGGLLYQTFFSSNSPFSMSNSVEENIIYDGSKIRVVSHNMYEKEFEIQGNQLVSQITTYKPGLNIFLLADYCLDTLNYTYQDNVVLERENNLTRRIFHLENGNLVKVELFLRNNNLENMGKIEYNFSEYDSNPNLLKGKFFIHGNFFKSFSNNNYKRFSVRRFDYVDGNYVLSQMGEMYSSSIENLPNDMFTENCQ